MRAEIREVLIIVSSGEEGAFRNLFGDGSSSGVHIEDKDPMLICQVAAQLYSDNT